MAPWSPVMHRSRILTLAAVAFLGGVAAAAAGPCTREIAQVERQIRQRPTDEIGPSAPQSIGAQLHHQPTPGAVASAEHKALALAAAALERAKKADAGGDAGACNRALDEARRLYGID